MSDTQAKKEKEEKNESKQTVLSSKNITMSEMKTLIDKVRAYKNDRDKAPTEQVKDAYLASLCPNPEDLIKLLAVYEELFPEDKEGISDIKEELEKEYKKKAKFMGVFLFMIADSLKSIYKKAFKNYVRAMSKENKLAQKQAEEMARAAKEGYGDPSNPKSRGGRFGRGMTASEFSKKEAEYEHRIAELERDAKERRDKMLPRDKDRFWGGDDRPSRRGTRGGLFDDDKTPRFDDKAPGHRNDGKFLREETDKFLRNGKGLRLEHDMRGETDPRRPHDTMFDEVARAGKKVIDAHTGAERRERFKRRDVLETAERLAGDIVDGGLPPRTNTEFIDAAQRGLKNGKKTGTDIVTKLRDYQGRVAEGLTTDTSLGTIGRTGSSSSTDNTRTTFVDNSDGSQLAHVLNGRKNVHATPVTGETFSHIGGISAVTKITSSGQMATTYDNVFTDQPASHPNGVGKQAKAGTYVPEEHLAMVKDGLAAAAMVEADRVEEQRDFNPAEAVFGIDFDNPVKCEVKKIKKKEEPQSTPREQNGSGIRVKNIEHLPESHQRILDQFMRENGHIDDMLEKF